MRRLIPSSFVIPVLFNTLCVAGISAPGLFAQTIAKPKTAAAAKIVEPPAALLPPAFDGWVESGKPVTGTKPADADPTPSAGKDAATNAAALADYGFERFAVEHYSRAGENNTPDTLTIKAMQFPDATGAYGAFTFYRKPNMASEDIGSQFAGSTRLGTGGASGPATSGPGSQSASRRILFWNGNILVDAEFSRTNAMTDSEMRDLAKMLPAATSTHALIPPPLPRYLPATGLAPMSVRYALGSSSYALTGGVLPPQLAGFGSSAEAVTASYSLGGGDGTLTLLEFPTPQLAMAAEKSITSLITSIKTAKNTSSITQNTAQITTNSPDSLANSAPASLQIHRSGPLLAITSGNLTEKQAQTLLGTIHYDADITWNNTQGYISEPTKAARLLVNIILGSSLICLFALALGIALGGGRALLRVVRGKPASAVDEVFEFTKLNLKD